MSARISIITVLCLSVGKVMRLTTVTCCHDIYFILYLMHFLLMVLQCFIAFDVHTFCTDKYIYIVVIYIAATAIIIITIIIITVPSLITGI